MKFFSEKTNAEGGTPRPDLKKFKDEDEFDIPQEQKTNRTQPKNMPTEPKPPLASLKAFNKRTSIARMNRKSALQPAEKDAARLVFNSNDWLFTQATAVASVPLEDDGYTIKSCGNDLVNNNGNAFSNDLMKKIYMTFIGAHNYVDHNQDPSDSRGIIIDTVLRKLPLSEAGDFGYYVDVLIATSKRKDPEWAKMIESGEVKYLSMGAESSALQCSCCGHISFDEDDECEHMLDELGYHYIDSDGSKRRIAALVTNDMNDEGESFAHFIELSYLSVDPAFTGAIRGHVLNLEPDTEVEVVIPRRYLGREAFQVHKDYIGGI